MSAATPSHAPEPDMSQSAVFRSATGSSFWSRLPIVYKLWLGLFWVPLLGLILPTVFFLPILHKNLEDQFEREWLDIVQGICTSGELLTQFESQDELNTAWGKIQEKGAAGLHLGFASEAISTAAPVDSAATDVGTQEFVQSGTTIAADAPSPFATAMAGHSSIAVFMKDQVDTAGPVIPTLSAFDQVATTPSRDMSVEQHDHWIASFGQGRPESSPTQIEQLSDASKFSLADWSMQLKTLDAKNMVIHARSSTFSGGVQIRTSKGERAYIVIVFLVKRDELLSEILRVDLIAVGLLMLGAAVLLPVTHVFLKMLVVGPVQSLARTMRSSKPDTLGELHVPITRHDEIGELQLALNVLAAEISTKQQELSRYNDELEARVQTRTAELERTNKELDAFAYTVSHDLQAPLRNVSYIVGDELPDAIHKGQLAKTNELIDEVKRLCDFNIKMVRGLLDWARIGRSATKPEAVSLQDLLLEVKSGLRTQLDEKQVELRVPRPLPVVQADMMQFHRVLTNLLSNALKYNDKPQKWIEVGWQAVGPEGPAMYVRDNGIGVRPQHIERLFSLLVQLHDRKRFGEGVGMGLAIVKRIVDSYNGKIWAESVHGEGTTFWFTLPPIVTSESLIP